VSEALGSGVVVRVTLGFLVGGGGFVTRSTSNWVKLCGSSVEGAD
jgi:hypothetical protein